MIVLVKKLNSKGLTPTKPGLLLLALSTLYLARFDHLVSTSIGAPLTKTLENVMVGPVVAKLPQGSQPEVSYPPRLPDGISVASATSEELIEPPSSLKRIAVAKTAVR